MKYIIIISVIILFYIIIILVSYKQKYNQLMFKKVNRLLSNKYTIKLNNNIINNVNFLKDSAVNYNITMNKKNKVINILNKNTKGR
jgi:hypothetical protein